MNAIGEDEAVCAKIRYDFRSEKRRKTVEEKLRARGQSYYFDTPLKIAENMLDSLESKTVVADKADKAALLSAIKLLKNHDGKSLSFPPPTIGAI